jgi:hypothetical protein
MLLEEFKRNLKGYLLIILIISLLGWNIANSFGLAKAETKVMVIKVTENGTTLVSEDNINDRDEQDINNLVNTFIINYYSFDSFNYDERKAKALYLTSDVLMGELYKKVKKEYEDVQLDKKAMRYFNQSIAIKSYKIINSEVVKVKLEKNFIQTIEYDEVDPNTGKKKRKTEENTTFSMLTFKMAAVPREKRVHGYEITELIESKGY